MKEEGAPDELKLISQQRELLAMSPHLAPAPLLGGPAQATTLTLEDQDGQCRGRMLELNGAMEVANLWAWSKADRWTQSGTGRVRGVCGTGSRWTQHGATGEGGGDVHD